MITVSTEIDIAAPPMKVWRALCDFPAYRRWNPYREIVGLAAMGETVTIRIGPDPAKRRAIRAKISAFVPGEELAFATGRKPWANAMESFRLEPSRRGVRLVHCAQMSGLGALWMRSDRFQAGLVRVYERVDAALAKYAATGPQPRKSPAISTRPRP
jgi:uncharacterized protein YndB with AHSA1/START domain